MSKSVSGEALARLNPEARAFIEAGMESERPNAHFLPVEEARANFDSDFAALGQGPDMAMVTDYEVPSPNGGFTARAYRPNGALTGGVIIYFHGGGWLLGSLDSHDFACRRLAAAAGTVLVAVDYRRGPDARFPAAVDDCVTAVNWVRANGALLDIDPDRVVLAGDSAGGNLALAVAVSAGTHAADDYRLLILIYPVTSTRLDDDTFDPVFEKVMLWRDELQWHQANYLSSEADRMSPLVSPLDTADLGQLPPALVLVAECDPIRPQGESLAEAIERAGGSVQLIAYPGLIHGFFGIGHVFGDVPDGVDDASTAIRRALA